MKKTYIVVQSSKTKAMLKNLRKAGVLHVTTASKAFEGSRKQEIEDVRKVISVLQEKVDKKHPVPRKALSRRGVVETTASLAALLRKREELIQKRDRDSVAAAALQPWGDFDPKELARLKEEGIELFFYTIDRKDLAKLDEEQVYYEVSYQGPMKAVATIGERLDPATGAVEVSFGEDRLSDLGKSIARANKELDEIDERLKESVAYLDALKHHQSVLEMQSRFEEVEATLVDEQELSYLVGYLPAKEEERFTRMAGKNGWAYLLEDVSEDDEEVPTLIEYTKGNRIIKPVFEILGTVPGYREHDISTWFLLFFTLFFAMIIGDAGYGFIFLLIALAIHVSKKEADTMVMLIYVLSIATIVWGSLTGTWFGSIEILRSVPFLRKLVIPQISNYPELFGVEAVSAQNTVMKFTFSIGTVQLSLACIINVLHKSRRKDLSFVADIGWLITILALYYIVLLLVIGTPVNVKALFGAIGISFVVILLFGAQGPGVSFAQGAKKGLAGFFTTFLDTVSAFSNIMSYIRLFA
ncbi:MAG: ATPase, partial [Spirochaetales bacterium]|nr:ATPase [Spirochaetales bacterium]